MIEIEIIIKNIYVCVCHKFVYTNVKTVIAL